MIGMIAALVLTLASVGIGAGVLRALSADGEHTRCERVLWSFVLGIGVMGWLLFFLGIAGLFAKTVFVSLTVAGAGLAVAFGVRGRTVLPAGPSQAPTTAFQVWAERALILSLAVAFCFDLAEGFAPPADADSLTYHFTLPKHFIETGSVYFVPRAVEGAIPLLMQMTYAAAFALGGELAMTLWVMISGWAAVALVYCTAKPHIGRTGGLAAALIVATTPAVIYGAGTGQIEMRNALFVLVGAAALARAVRTDSLGAVAIAGLCAGFFAGTKYTGLLFVAASGLTLMLYRRDMRALTTFAAFSALAGGQWYLWNWYNTGDPIFPLLFGLLPYKTDGLWDAAHRMAFQQFFFEAEKAVPINPWQWLLYPFRATLDPPVAFEARRIGFGPLGLLLTPFVGLAAWQYRSRIMASRLTVFAVVIVFFYGLWFFTGSSQRVRHLLPVYPLLVACLMIAAWKWSARSGNMGALATALALTISLQIGAHAVFSAKFFDYLTNRTSRDAFVDRNVPLSMPVKWINANLTQKNRILLDVRYLAYLVEVPYFDAHPFHQAQINILPNADDPALFLRQLRRERIDHILVSNWQPPPSTTPYKGKLGLVHGLMAHGCARIKKRFQSRRFMSRTFPNLHSITQEGVVLSVSEPRCELDMAP